MEFFIDLMTNGLLVGLMYALVAVGFVLIYKATSILNFAQGDLVMFAGYAAAVMLGMRGCHLAYGAHSVYWHDRAGVCPGAWHLAADGRATAGLRDHGDDRFELCAARAVAIVWGGSTRNSNAGAPGPL